MRRVAFLLALLTIVVAGPATAVELIEAVKPAQVQPAGGVQVEIAQFGPIRVAYVEHTGPYDTIGKAIALFTKQLNKQKIKPAGPLMGIYYDDPATTPANALRWDIAIQVAEDAAVAAPLKTRVIEPCLVARTAFQGTPAQLGPVYAQLIEAAAERPVAPCARRRSMLYERPASRAGVIGTRLCGASCGSTF